MDMPVLSDIHRRKFARQEIPMIEWHTEVSESMPLGNGIGKVYGIIEYRLWHKSKDGILSCNKFKNFIDALHNYDTLIDNDTKVYVHFMAVIVTEHFEPSKNPKYELNIDGQKIGYDKLNDTVVVEIPVCWLTESHIPRKI